MAAFIIALNTNISLALEANRLQDFEAFANGIFETILAEKNIAGATFSVVHKGEVMMRNAMDLPR
jgi:hypothetical protein